MRKQWSFLGLLSLILFSGMLVISACKKDDSNKNNLVCDGRFIDVRDNQEYCYVDIGTQRWMAENLNYAASDSLCYNTDLTNCDTYGRLYDWSTLMAGGGTSNNAPSGVRGLCPEGWHLPSDAEWIMLVNFLGNSAGAMKSTSELWSVPNEGATNSSGFSALPGGFRYADGNFGNLGAYASFWSATESNATYALYRNLSYGNNYIYQLNYNKDYGFSCRCVAD